MGRSSLSSEFGAGSYAEIRPARPSGFKNCEKVVFDYARKTGCEVLRARLPLLKTPPKGAPEFAPSSWGELRNYSDMPRMGPLTDTQTRHLIHG